MLFDQFVIIDSEETLVAAIEDCVKSGQPHLQLTARPNKMKSKMMSAVGAKKCHECGAVLTGAKFCTNCGAKPQEQAPEKKPEPKPVQQASGDVCVECKHALNGKKFCTNCGAEAPQKKPEPKPVQQATGDLCLECKHALNGKKFCTNCGAKAPEKKPEPKKEEPKKDVCPSCQFEWGTAKFCTNCGHKRGDVAAPQTSVPEPVKPTSTPKNKFVKKPVTKEGDEEHCGRCGELIGGGIKALNRVWHTKCFNCVYCGCDFGNGKGLMEKDGNPTCSECYTELFAEKCQFCHKSLTNGYVIVEGQMAHPECFCCCKCGQMIVSSYFKKFGRIYCPDCK
jgi:hypothetical protein